MEKLSDQCPAFKVSTEEQFETCEINSNAGRLHVCNSVPQYSEQEIQALAERLVNEETFREAQQVLISWLGRGECKKRNSEHFYYLIQLCWNHFEKLLTEQKEHVEEAESARSLGKKCSIQDELNEFEKIFKEIENQDIWGNFTHIQVEKLQEMRKDILNLKQNISTDVSVNFEHVEIEMDPESIMQTKIGSLTDELNAVNSKKEDLKIKCEEYENEIIKLKSELEKSRKLREKNNSVEVGDNQQKSPCVDVASQCDQDKKEMHIISLASVFLFDHPHGVNINCIYSRLNKFIPITHAEEIEVILRKFPKIFKESSPIGAMQEKKWTCISVTQETLMKLLNKQ